MNIGTIADNPAYDHATALLSLKGWDESAHPRSDNGEFGSGGSSRAKMDAAIGKANDLGVNAAMIENPGADRQYKLTGAKLKAWKEAQSAIAAHKFESSRPKPNNPAPPPSPHARSVGHLAFVRGSDGTTYEVARGSDGDHYAGSVDNAMQANGWRAGMRQAPFGLIEEALKDVPDDQKTEREKRYWPSRKSYDSEVPFMDETLVNFGGELKAMGVADGKGRIGGYLVRWGTADEPDLVGDYFTAKTYFGANDGNGADAMIHHGLPLTDRNGRPIPELSWTTDKLLPALKTKRDEVGLFAETVCDMSDDWEAKVYELAAKGKFKWSSGASPHTVRRKDGVKSGEIIRWPIVEGSLTPCPCEPRNTQVMSLKAYLEVKDVMSESNGYAPQIVRTGEDGKAKCPYCGEMVAVDDGMQECPECHKPLEVEKKSIDSDEPIAETKAIETLTASLPDGLRFEDHSTKVLDAMSEWIGRVHDKAETASSRKSGRVYSSDNWQKMDDHCNALGAMHADLRSHLDEHKPGAADDAEAKSLPALIQSQIIMARLNGVPV